MEEITKDTKQAADSTVSRRTFIADGALAAAAIGAVTVGGAAATALAQPGSGGAGGIPAGDIAILQFLAAAELVEDDLWQQYCELATSNPGFRAALERIDPAMVAYICQDRDDERSHAMLINGFLQSIGAGVINLDAFRRLPSSVAPGAARVGRLTNLSQLTVDTSWYLRYRGEGNPDFGDTFPQIVTINNRPTIPLSRNLSDREFDIIAQSAAFHFAAIEQGGSSLYTYLSQRVSSPEAKSITASIGPTEVYHFAVFQTALEGIRGLDGGNGLVFPDFQNNAQLRSMAQNLMPRPCRFLSPNLPLCSVIRPSLRQNSGAVAAATGLVQSGLFRGQSATFFNAVVALATAADAV
jgi:hypothetical protein